MLAPAAATSSSACCRSAPACARRPLTLTKRAGARLPRSTARLQARRQAVVVAAAAADAASLQLATAKLPEGVNKEVFCQQLYQFAATLTTNGRNLPFALPLKTDRLADGFQISLLRVAGDGAVVSVADIAATVEAVPGAGDVLFVRLLEGAGAAEVGLGGGSADPQQRLQTLLDSCVDVPLIMQTLPGAIRRAVMVSR